MENIDDDEAITIAVPVSSSEADESKSGDDNSLSSVETSLDGNPALFRGPILTNKSSNNIYLNNNAQSSYPGAFRVAGINRNSRQHNPRHDIPVQPVPLGDASQPTETFEEPVAALTAVMVENPLMIDYGAVALVLSELEEKEISFPQRKRVFAWCVVLLVVLLTVVFCISWFLRPGEKSAERLIAPTLTPTISPTSSSLPEQVDWLLQNDISVETALFRKDSPQAKAVAWWMPEQNFRVSLQRYVLAVFYFAMGGEQWKSCGQGQSNCAPAGRPQNWLNHAASECEWIDISCDAAGTVIRLDFESLKTDTVDPDNFVELKTGRIYLDGELPPEIRHLMALEEFIAPSMNVQGSLDVWEDLVHLRVLNVQYNALTGTLPPNLANLSNLQTLDLKSNQLNGKIPSSLGLAPSLEILRLSENRLQGQVPLNLFHSPNLKQVVFGENEALSGSIPATVGNMSSLEVLDLHMTRMEGEIPPELFLVPNLQILDLSHAQFRGVLTEDIRLVCDTLRVLRVNDNSFFGNIPTALDECTRLEELVLTNTDITGEISESLCRERGTSAFQLSILKVDCAVACNCCGSRNCP